MEVHALSASADPVMTSDGERRRNLRTALILLSVAAVFFAGVVIRHWFYGG